jgi:undecaprenyl-diphosphatase
VESRFFSNHRVESRILLGFVGVVVVVLAFAKAAAEISEGDTLSVDRFLLMALRIPGNPGVPIGPRWLQQSLIDVTALGGVTVLTLITCLAAGYLVAARKPASAAFTGAAVGAGALLGNLLKGFYERARPEVVEHLVGTNSTSFPSGHAMNSAIVYLTLAVLIARSSENRSVRLYIICVAIALTLIIGFSRVYLGVHWPTDVVAGWTVGGVWAALCSLVAKRLQSGEKVEKPS